MHKLAQIKDWLQAKVIQKGDEERQISTILTDSRQVSKADQSIFFPLVTGARDGHEFILKAYAKGVRCFVISKHIDVSLFPDATMMLVEDTLKALQTVVANHRSQYQIPIIGITGSNGKTIVKEWLSVLLQDSEYVIKSPKSYNSQIGVPLSVWPISDTHTIGLFEAGISEKGEMANLESIIKPTHGVFTSIGKAHDSGFDNLEQKIKEKLILFKDSTLLVYGKDNADIDRCVQEKYGKTKLLLKSWGWHSDATLRIIEIRKDNYFSFVDAVYEGHTISIEIPFQDQAHIENALSCWLVLLSLGKRHELIAPKFARLQPISMRLELKQGIHRCTLINDSYSSDTASLAIALDLLQQQNQHRKKTLILSDIIQQGAADMVYDQLSKMLAERKLDHIIFIGEDLNRYQHLFTSLAPKEHFYPDTMRFIKDVDNLGFDNEAILIKGAREFAFEKIVNRLEEKIHQTVLSINLSALVHNIKVYKKMLGPSVKMMAMVKAFSYGSGSFEIANVLQHYGMDYLAVAYADEGIELRRNGINLPILILNPDIQSLDAMLHYHLEPEIFSVSNLVAFAQKMETSKVKLPVHIKLDTGMHRLGIEEKDLDDFIQQLKNSSSLIVKSIFSHLVGSDNASFDDFTSAQSSQFERMSAKIKNNLEYPVLRHLCNSSGAFRHPNLQYDMVRVGLGLYGIDPNPTMQNQLLQISTLKASISQIKELDSADTVGYSRAGKLRRKSKIATLNIGYADGYSRAFSKGKGKVWIKGHLAPVVGNVCMDMTMVDVTDIADINEGDEVIIFGEQLSVKVLAEWIDTIPYEIITSISQRVNRVYYQD